MLLKRREGNPQDRGSPESTDLGTVARRVARRRAAPREAKGCDFLTILGHFRLEFVLSHDIETHSTSTVSSQHPAIASLGDTTNRWELASVPDQAACDS